MNRKETLITVKLLMGVGRYQEAIDFLLEYLKFDPNSAIILNTLGKIYLLNKQPENAKICLTRSLEKSQGSSITHIHESLTEPD